MQVGKHTIPQGPTQEQAVKVVSKCAAGVLGMTQDSDDTTLACLVACADTLARAQRWWHHRTHAPTDPPLSMPRYACALAITSFGNSARIFGFSIMNGETRSEITLRVPAVGGLWGGGQVRREGVGGQGRMTAGRMGRVL